MKKLKDEGGRGADMQPASRLTHTVEETAGILGIGRNQAYEGVASGDIPSLRIGRRILVPRVALEQMLAKAVKA